MALTSMDGVEGDSDPCSHSLRHSSLSPSPRVKCEFLVLCHEDVSSSGFLAQKPSSEEQFRRTHESSSSSLSILCSIFKWEKSFVLIFLSITSPASCPISRLSLTLCAPLFPSLSSCNTHPHVLLPTYLISTFSDH